MDNQAPMVPEAPVRLPRGSAWQDLTGLASSVFALMKPRIVLELLVTAFCAMVVADAGLPGIGRIVLTMLGLGLSAGGANAINMWYDRDIDGIMARTQKRPVPSGRLPAEGALVAGIVMQLVSFLLLWLWVGHWAAVLSLAGFVYYVFLYTMLLKRRTPQNIVIGGGAGAFPPLVGWAAVTGHLGVAPLLMFLIIFLWTPPHFWALALYREGDYRRASIPMMPVVRGARSTKLQSLGYTVALLVASLLLFWTGKVGVVYLAVALVLGLGFIATELVLLREREPETRMAKATFRYSLVYLTVLFGTMVFNVRP